MNQRINPTTGYPMSTDKQIKVKKEALSMVEAFHEENPHEAEIKFLKELDLHDPRDERTILSDKIYQHITGVLNAEAELHYKMGLWDKAENEYLQIFYLSVYYTDALRILYFKEHRYRDAVYILEFTMQTVQEFSQLFYKKDYDTLSLSLEKAKNIANKKARIDTSHLSSEQKVVLTQTAGKNFRKIKSWMNEISEKRTNFGGSKMGFFDSISKKMEERSEKKKQEKAEYNKVLTKFKNNDAKKFENYYFDLKDNQILEIQNIFTKKYRIIDFKDVLSYSINKTEHNDSKTQTKRKHGIGRAVVGGVLLGPIGAAVGGLTSKKETQTISKDFVDHLGVVINLTDGTSFEITYFDSTLKADNSLVAASIKQVNQLATVLETGIENAKRQQSTTVAISSNKAKEDNAQPATQSSPDTDPLDEIKKLKGLLDIGAITPEEFDAKKKQLLNL